jgi:ankyrin repeat protein
VTRLALDDVRQQDRFFDLVQRGGEKDLPLIVRELESDPKKYFYDRNNPMHLINKTNRMNQTPLYLACRNGNLSIVQFLLEQQADPHLLSNVDDHEKENILQVAIRWNHRHLVVYLLGNVKWTENEIRNCIKLDGLDPQLLMILKVYSKQHYGCLFNFCLCV